MDVDQMDMTVAERLREFEDTVLGKDHPRIHDKIERGIGSPFSRLDQKHRDHHAALEALMAAEKEHETASAAEDVAHKKLQAAVERVSETGKNI